MTGISTMVVRDAIRERPFERLGTGCSFTPRHCLRASSGTEMSRFSMEQGHPPGTIPDGVFGKDNRPNGFHRCFPLQDAVQVEIHSG